MLGVLDLKQRPPFVDRGDWWAKWVWLWSGCKIDFLLCVKLALMKKWKKTSRHQTLTSTHLFWASITWLQRYPFCQTRLYLHSGITQASLWFSSLYFHSNSHQFFDSIPQITITGRLRQPLPFRKPRRRTITPPLTKTVRPPLFLLQHLSLNITARLSKFLSSHVADFRFLLSVFSFVTISSNSLHMRLPPPSLLIPRAARDQVVRCPINICSFSQEREGKSGAVRHSNLLLPIIFHWKEVGPDRLVLVDTSRYKIRSFPTRSSPILYLPTYTTSTQLNHVKST